MKLVQLGQSDLQVTPICLGTMTFGQQVNEADSHAILDRSLDAGINFIDTAEMYAVPASADTCGATETFIGHWFAKQPGARQKLVLATKVAGPSRGMPWIREGSGMTAQDILNSCDASLRRPRGHKLRGLANVVPQHLVRSGQWSDACTLQDLFGSHAVRCQRWIGDGEFIARLHGADNGRQTLAQWQC
jgi:predicted oxidoreductase